MAEPTEIARRGFLVAYATDDEDVARVVNENDGDDAGKLVELWRLDKWGWDLSSVVAPGR